MGTNKKLYGLADDLGKGFIEGMTVRGEDKDNQNRSSVKILLALCGILLLIGTEPFKVLLRKRIDEAALTIESIVLSGLVFILIGGLIITESLGIKQVNENIAGAIGYSYIILGIGVLVCGIKEYRARNTFGRVIPYRGDSILFGKLIDKGTSSKRIWTVYEPLTCMYLGFMLCLIHPLFGLPILAASLSFIINENYQVRWKIPSLSRKMAHMTVVSNEIRAGMKSNNDETNYLREGDEY